MDKHNLCIGAFDLDGTVPDMGKGSLKLSMSGVTKATGPKKLYGSLGTSLNELAVFGGDKDINNYKRSYI